jgi:hypothetical protein
VDEQFVEVFSVLATVTISYTRSWIGAVRILAAGSLLVLATIGIRMLSNGYTKGLLPVRFGGEGVIGPSVLTLWTLILLPYFVEGGNPSFYKQIQA